MSRASVRAERRAARSRSVLRGQWIARSVLSAMPTERLERQRAHLADVMRILNEGAAPAEIEQAAQALVHPPGARGRWS